MGSGDLLVLRATTTTAMETPTQSEFSEDQVMLEMLHGGRPRNEEPHVKKRMGKHGEKVDLILRVDLEELGITDDEFDDIQSLFQLYDHDKDGILNFKESQKVLRCLGLRVSEDQAKILIKKVSADRHGFSVSFNEYLRLVSIQRRLEPDEQCLLGTYRRAQSEFSQQKINDYFFCNSVTHCPPVI